MTLIKPRRTFSRGLIVATVAPAWSCILASMWMGPPMASIVLPSMVLLIAGAIGIYQGVGHADFRAQLQPTPPSEPEETDR